MTRPGEAEGIKGAVHAVSGALALAMSLYNSVAYSERAEKRLAVQSLFYGLLWVWETRQSWQHWSHQRIEK